MQRLINIIILFCSALLFGLVCGCGSMATKTAFYQPITTSLRSDSTAAAAQMVEVAREGNKYGQKDRLLYFLDAGLLHHYAGNYALSNQKLTLAEAAAEELFTKSVSKAALSMVLNDNALEYSGEDFEILYTNIIKTLNYIAMDSLQAAMVEIRRVNLKLDLLENKYADLEDRFRYESQKDSSYIDFDYDIQKVKFHNDALARYLGMHLYAASGYPDDARIDREGLKRAFDLQPHIYDFAVPEVRYWSEEGSILSVVALAGLAPVKDALSFRLRTDKNLNLVQILYDDPDRPHAEYTHFPAAIGEDYYFKFAIPELVPRPSIVSGVRLLIDGQPAGELQLIENLNTVSAETYKANKSWIMIRTVARALAKGLSAHQLKKKVDDGGLGGWLKKLTVDVVTDLTENADLRGCRYLPAMAFVGDFVVPSGSYNLSVQFLDLNGHTISTTNYDSFMVRSNGLNMIEAFTAK